MRREMATEMEIPPTNEMLQDGEMANGSMLEGDESSDVMAFKEARPMHKAKRHLKQTFKTEELNGVTMTSPVNEDSPSLAAAKNSKKSRMGRGRGLPKKGGAGGKGTWGAPGSEIDAIPEATDHHDPNYDSDCQDLDYEIEEVSLELSSAELAKEVTPLIKEYFEHGDSNEVLDFVSKLHISVNKHEVPEIAVSLGMERHDPQREMTSQLISDLYGRFLSQDDIAETFDNLIENLNDLSLDTPDAANLLGMFIARAVADDCLPPKFVQGYRGKVKCTLARQALDKADVLLSMNHGIVRLDNVWGCGGGNRPVKYLTNSIRMLVQEYFSSGDIQEATRCLKELDVPHFYHELVYQAILMAIEDSTDKSAEMAVRLLQSLSTSAIVTRDQLKKGMKRICDDLPDISVDVPNAHVILEQLGTKLLEFKVISETLYRDLPVRGRKRFVSEGDGGKVKNTLQ